MVAPSQDMWGTLPETDYAWTGSGVDNFLVTDEFISRKNILPNYATPFFNKLFICHRYFIKMELTPTQAKTFIEQAVRKSVSSSLVATLNAQ